MTGFRNRSVYANILVICMIAVLMGQFYISPADIGFRLTLAVFFMSLFLLYFTEYSVMLITMSVGISTFLFRSTVYFLSHGGVFQETIIEYLPVLSYYFFFGVLFILLDVRSQTNKPFKFFLTLWVCDATPNIIEASIRRSWMMMPFDRLVILIAIAGLIRTVVTLGAFYSARYYMGRFRKNEREKYSREILVYLARLKTELFLLNKSRDDIERAVALGHDLYNQVNDDEIKKPLIHLVKEVHEIKKDYLRVIAGMNAVFNIETEIRFLSIKEILDYVADNVRKLAGEQGKDIVVKTDYDEMFITKDFYPLVSILDNLTFNSLEAIEQYGEISLSVKTDSEKIRISVMDTGCGISSEKLERIFHPGYTTKYDRQTGKMSTGVGLSHVKELVYDLFGGEIEVESVVGQMTRFTLLISRDRLMEREVEI